MKDVWFALSLIWLIPFSIGTIINIGELQREVYKLINKHREDD